MDKLHQKLTELFGEQRILQNEPLTSYLTSNLLAPLFITVVSKQELRDCIQAAKGSNVPFLIIDQDNDKLDKKTEISGLVIKNNARKFDIIARKGKMQSRRLITDYALLEAESGVPVNQLVRYSIDQGLGGVEELLGTAGTLGKFLSDGTHDEILRLPIQSVTILTPTSESAEIPASDLKKDLIVLSVIFKLIGEDSKILWLKAKRSAEARGITEYL